MSLLFNAFSKQQSSETTKTTEMESTKLVQDSQLFVTNFLDIAKCQRYLISVLHWIFDGGEFSNEDKEKVFFNITQAFNNKDLLLHRLLLMVVKFMKVPKDYGIMLTHSLSGDIAGTSDMVMNKARAVRLLPTLLDAGTIMSQERFLKQIIIGNEPFSSASALSCALAMCLSGNNDVVNKWLFELHQAAASSNSATQFFALLILYYLRKDDGNIIKMSEQFKDKREYSSLSTHVMIQVCFDANRLSGSDSTRKYLLNKLQSPSPITQIDAARAILSNKNSKDEDISAAVSKLNNLLSSISNVAIFASLRTIGQYASTRREEFSKCNTILERLLSHSDNNISALAAIALLHTGFESTIDRVLPVVKQFAEKLNTEQQKSLLNSCGEVVRRHPSKLEYILTFIWSTFRAIDDLGVQKIFVNELIGFASFVQQSKSSVFGYLCEYIEDSKYVELTLLIIRFLGEKGPEQENKSEIFRCLCNRLLLETIEIRAASIDALACFAQCEDIKISVLRVIQKYISDSDDEVRDRAVFHYQVIQNQYKQLMNIPRVKIVTKEKTEDSSIKEQKQIIETVLTKYGTPLYESPFIEATDKDSDLVVTYSSTVFKDVIAFEFNITNTLSFKIVNVSINMELISGNFEEYESISCDEIDVNSTGSSYCIFTRDSSSSSLNIGSFRTEVIFCTEDDDSEEVFELDNDVKLTLSTYIKPTALTDISDSLSGLVMKSEKVALKSMKSVDDTIAYFQQASNLHITGKEVKQVQNGKKKQVVVKMTGSLPDGHPVASVIELVPLLRGIGAHIHAYAPTESLANELINSFIG